MPGDKDDDFMSDVSSVISQAEDADGFEDVTSNPDFSKDVKTDDSKNKTNEDVLDLIETPQEKAERKEKKEREKLTVKKPEEKPQEQQVKTEDTKTQTQKQEEQKQLNVHYMDKFLKDDSKGNLVLADGTIIAMSGKSRAYYEGLKTEARNFRDAADKLALSNAQLGNKFKELYAQFEQVKNNSGITSIVKEAGLEQHEFQQGLQLMKQYKKDPVTAIRSLLTQARLNGIDLSSIGVNGGIDPATIANAIAAAKTMQSEKQELSQEDQHRVSIEKEVNAFFDRNPEALNHVDIIASAKDKYPDLSLDEIWIKLQIWQRTKAAETALAQEEANATNQQQVQTQPKQQPRRFTSVVNDHRDYGSMSIDEIAATLKKDMLNA